MSISEKDAVLRERKAFIESRFTVQADPTQSLENWAAQRYPLPKVTRDRVWVEPASGMGFKVVRGDLWFTNTMAKGYVQWRFVDPSTCEHEVTAERIRAWCDLLTNPTEEVEA